MKKFAVFSVFVLLFCSFVFVGCTTTENIVRIHIRANSNSECDQEVKLLVRDEVIEYITPLLAECGDCEEVKCVLEDNLISIEEISNSVLSDNGFNYCSFARINYEYFPTRSYGGEVYPADYYDALIVELGSGKGDNWWCVAYPPLCFVGENMGDNVVYKSKLMELVNKFIGG